MNKELEEFKKLAYENQETAIKLLKENVELKEKAKLYEILIEDTANNLKTIEEDRGARIEYLDVKGALEVAIEDNFDKLIEMVEKYFKSL